MTYLIIIISIFLALYDIKKKRVPNIITLLLFLAALLYKIVFKEELIYSLLSGVGAFVTFLIVYLVSKGKMGMGDCKYTAVIAFYFGYYFWLQSILYTSVIAIIVSLVLLMLKKIDRETKIPFMPFLVSGWILNYIYPLPI